jgi:hypothetical protein
LKQLLFKEKANISVTVDVELIIELILFLLGSSMNLVKLRICFQIALFIQSSHYIAVQYFVQIEYLLPIKRGRYLCSGLEVNVHPLPIKRGRYLCSGL